MDGDVQRCEKEVHCACQRTLCDAPEGTHPLTCKKIIGVLQIKVNRFCRKSPKKYSADSRVKMRTANRTPSKIGGSQMA